jgi:hypothetical protein
MVIDRKMVDGAIFIAIGLSGALLLPKLFVSTQNIFLDVPPSGNNYIEFWPIHVTSLGPLKLGEIIKGNVIVTGGNKTINFEVIDPDGIIIYSVKVVQRCEFSFKRFKDGTYTFYFVNKEASGKTVKVSFSGFLAVADVPIQTISGMFFVLIGVILLLQVLFTNIVKKRKQIVWIGKDKAEKYGIYLIRLEELIKSKKINRETYLKLHAEYEQKLREALEGE